MNIWESILFGVVQGITEYLPVSSSAHLILLPRFLGTQDPGLAFDVFLHAGTLASTLWFFKKDWVALFSEGMSVLAKKPGNFFATKLGWVAAATVPALAFGAVFRKVIASELRANSILVVTLALGGLLLWAVDLYRERFLKSSSQKKTADLGVRGAIAIGFFQCLALVPGMSRSGSTLIGGRTLGLSRQEAARFSFWLSAPITAAALVFEMRHFDELLQSQVGAAVLIAGFASSFLAGWAAIGFLLKFVSRMGFLGFAIYRIALAFAIFKVLGV
ncbi:MAG: undecaprenyl-diphosphate phosphatase [Bdellovibrionales bacterium]|nr:undecaprenyl-diphosphate phosphatase [Bdellovibrionales bacterium]